MCFNKYSFCVNIPTLTNHFSSLLLWLTLSGRGDLGEVVSRVQSFFRTKMAWNFLIR